MVDLHSHLLDDNTKTVSDIVRYLKFARRRGISKVLFTPKIKNLKRSEKLLSNMNEKFMQVKEEVKRKNIDIEVSLGVEIYAYNEMLDDVKTYLRPFSNARHLIIDVSNYRSSIDDLAYTLSVHGYTPIFTHVEDTKYKSLSTHAKKWHSSGAYILVSSKRLFGNSISATRVRQLLRANQIDFVASGRNRKLNPFLIYKLAKYYVKLIVGPKYADKVFSLNARNLLQEEEKPLSQII